MFDQQYEFPFYFSFIFSFFLFWILFWILSLTKFRPPYEIRSCSPTTYKKMYNG